MIEKTIRIMFAVRERLGEQFLAGLKRKFVRRKLFFLLPLPAHVFVQRVRAVGEIVELHVREFVDEVTAEGSRLSGRVHAVGGDSFRDRE